MKKILGDKFQNDIVTELDEQNIVQMDLNSTTAIDSITNTLVNRNAKSTDCFELFYATVLAEEVFGSEDVLVCFELKQNISSKDIKNVGYSNLVDLLRKDTSLDFAICKNGNLVQFQLKQYKGSLETGAVADFIEQKVKNYGRLGNVNLLVVLQGDDNDGSQVIVTDINYCEIHQRLKNCRFETNAEVLIHVNDRNKDHVLTQVHPGLIEYRFPRMEEILF